MTRIDTHAHVLRFTHLEGLRADRAPVDGLDAYALIPRLAAR